MRDEMSALYEVVRSRRDNPLEGSYTNYLLEKGLDKILKKLGEECAETIIASKNGLSAEVVGEAADLLYHLTVLLCALDIPWEEVAGELERRSAKIGNLKPSRQTDRDT